MRDNMGHAIRMSLKQPTLPSHYDRIGKDVKTCSVPNAGTPDTFTAESHRRHIDATMAILRVVFTEVLAGVVSVLVFRGWDCGTTHMVFGVVLALLPCVFTLRRSRRECCFTRIRFRIQGAQSYPSVCE